MTLLRAAALALAAVAFAPAANAAQTQFLVADLNAASDSSGAVIGIGPNGAQTFVSTNAMSAAVGGPSLFSQPNDVQVAPNGDVYVLDNQGLDGKPRLLKIDPATGRETEVSTNDKSAAAGGEADFDSPTHLTITQAGTFYVTDPDLNTLDQKGGIIQIDPSTGKQKVVASNAISSGQGGE